MAVSIIFQNNRYQNDYHQYVADTPDDVKKIRVSPADMGSEVYVISEKKTYILDSNRTWHVKLVNTSGSGSSGDGVVDGGTIECDHNHVDENTIWENLPEPEVH